MVGSCDFTRYSWRTRSQSAFVVRYESSNADYRKQTNHFDNKYILLFISNNSYLDSSIRGFKTRWRLSLLLILRYCVFDHKNCKAEVLQLPKVQFQLNRGCGKFLNRYSLKVCNCRDCTIDILTLLQSAQIN